MWVLRLAATAENAKEEDGAAILTADQCHQRHRAQLTSWAPIGRVKRSILAPVEQVFRKLLFHPPSTKGGNPETHSVSSIDHPVTGPALSERKKPKSETAQFDEGVRHKDREASSYRESRDGEKSQKTGKDLHPFILMSPFSRSFSFFCTLQYVCVCANFINRETIHQSRNRCR